MGKMARRCLPLLAILLAGPLRATEVFYDYADVTSVHPVVEHTAPATAARRCRSAAPPASRNPKVVAAEGEGIATLVEALRAELDGLNDAVSCRSAAASEQTIVGYRVTYRYGNTEYVRMMERDPGTRMRVRVRLDPGR